MPDHDDLLSRKLTRSIAYELETIDGYTLDQVLESIAFASTAGATFLAKAMHTDPDEREAAAQYYRMRLAELVYDHGREQARQGATA